MTDELKTGFAVPAQPARAITAITMQTDGRGFILFNRCAKPGFIPFHPHGDRSRFEIICDSLSIKTPADFGGVSIASMLRMSGTGRWAVSEVNLLLTGIEKEPYRGREHTSDKPAVEDERLGLRQEATPAQATGVPARESLRIVP